ncbi:hypothetical protein C8F01DRAFT_1286910 [Mycena amicta]|nr:hypothetical protein C8F01DRAFT_1286910 [Mycena amicta]
MPRFLSFPCVCMLLSVWILTADAQLESVSSGWRKADLTTPLQDRMKIAEAAIDQGLSNESACLIQPGNSQACLAWGVAGDFYCMMADFDIVSNQTKYGSTLANLFQQAQNIPGRQNFTDEFVCLNYALSYGRAAVRAYQAYGNHQFLDYATQSWWFGRSLSLSASDVTAKKNAWKNFTLQSDCAAIPIVGGTFHDDQPDDPDLNGLSTGSFFITSALLAKATSNSLYLDAALDSKSFFEGHLINGRNQVLDTLDAASCAPTNLIESYNAGFMMQGLAVMYSITKNASIQTQLDDIVTAALIPTPSWQNSNGIIANSDLNLALGIWEAYTRNATSPALHDLLGKYLTVQFNAVVDLATVNGSNVYALSWMGPPSSEFSGINQTSALSALVSAISIVNQTSPVPTPSSANPLASSSGEPIGGIPPTKAKSQVLIGAAIGGATVGIIVILLMLWILHRRYQRSRAYRPETISFSWPSSDSWPGTSDTGNTHLSATTRKAVSVPRNNTASTQSRKNGHTVPVAAANAASGSSLQQNAVAAHSTRSATTGDTRGHRHSPGLSTEQLVQLLNERLQDQNWDAGEVPPQYSAGS